MADNQPQQTAATQTNGNGTTSNMANGSSSDLPSKVVNGSTPDAASGSTASDAHKIVFSSGKTEGKVEESAGTWYQRSCKDTPPKDDKKSSNLEVNPDKKPTVFISQDNLWQSTPQFLSYFFLDGTEVQHEKVKKTIVEWTLYANVAFTQARTIEASNIRIRFDPDDGSWSYVGRQNNSVDSKAPTMNLAWLDKNSPGATTNERAVILHEFGHVLGLLHEHQSPAHKNNAAVVNIDATLDLYRRTQGWTDQQIFDQVINVYKMSDVSNFSEVDTTSIMQYPQPKEITGLDHDIPYNEKLSDIDKAYMLLQYPRHPISPEATKEGWTYERALQVISAPAHVVSDVLGFLDSDYNPVTGQISPTNIRNTIESWCRAAHRGEDTSKPASSTDPAHTVSDTYKGSTVRAKVKDSGDLCSTDAAQKSRSSGPGAPAHAVTVVDRLWPLPKDALTEVLEITYIMRTRVAGTKDKDGLPSPYQKSLVETAMATWSEWAGVKFNPASMTDKTAVDLVIEFTQNADPKAEYEPEGSTRSKTFVQSGTDLMKRRTDSTRLAKTWATLDADIVYEGVFVDKAAAERYGSKVFETSPPLNGVMLNQRTTIHELGHWLGLTHEENGLYAYWMTDALLMAGAQVKRDDLWATRYDAGSVMDTIGMYLTSKGVEALKYAGLQPASVTKLNGNILNTVMISLGLSKYDQANIALLYPSTQNLVDTDGKSFKLKKSSPAQAESPTVLKNYLEFLKLDTATNIQQLTTSLVAGKWEDARKSYISMLGAKQTQEAPRIAEFLTYVAKKLTVVKTVEAGVFDVFLTESKPSGPSSGVGPIGAPLRDGAVAAPATPAQPLVPTGDGAFIQILYKKLTELISPGGGQYFALQFPTRYLDKQSYAYKLEGIFSRFDKPVVVNEAEFALTDALYEVAPIVGGPNGQTLSRNYEKALNSLIPTFESAAVRKQREKMRQWLLKETKAGNAAYTMDTRLAIPGLDAQSAKELSQSSGLTITPGPSSTAPLADQTLAKQMAQQAIDAIKRSPQADPRGMTRIEFSDSLMQAYLKDREIWELKRDDMIKEASEKAATDPQAMEKLTRRLAHITALEESKLASKYADAVVRGYSHSVRGFMGHLDIKTLAESLQDAKDSFRESALSSLYTASKVYPVAMLPADWFEALDTGFTREDLSQDPDLISAAVKAKAQLIDNLENQISNLRGFNKGDPDEAKAAVEAAAARREQALAALSSKYTTSTITAVKLALQAVAAATPAGGAITAVEQAAALKALPADDPKRKGLAGVLGDDMKVLDDIGKQMDEVANANAAVNSASRALTERMSEYATAVAGDTRTMIDGIQRQLTAAQKDLADLQETFTIATRAKKPQSTDVGSLDDVGKLPAGNGGSRWFEVHVQSSVSNDYTDSTSTTSSSVTSSSCNFWLGSYSSSNAQNEAANTTKHLASTLTVDVSMRVTYVTVDRSGWFDPSFFDLSRSFMQGTDYNYEPWSKWKDGQTSKDAAAAVKADDRDKPAGYLAAYPVGYILVKDCVIKVGASGVDSSSFKQHFDKQAESSGGFLCFSHSSASRSSSDSSASTTAEASGGIVVRIPGPQILGYMMQLTAQDSTQPFKEAKPEDLFLEDMDDDADKPAPRTNPVPAPARDVNFGGQSNKTPANRTMGVRGYDDQFRGAGQVQSGSGSSTTITPPEHGVQGPGMGAAGAVKPGNMVDALKAALGASEVGDWLKNQPQTTKEDLFKQLADILGKAKAS